MNKKRLAVRVFVILFALFGSSSVFAITINFQPLSTAAHVGDTVDVDVVVSGLWEANEIVSTYDLFIGYDASVLNASSVSFGPYLDDFLYPPIQFEDFGGQDPVLHFAHPNAYPPTCFTPLLLPLTKDYHVIAMHHRPLWPGSKPEEFESWQVIADDLYRPPIGQSLGDHPLDDLIHQDDPAGQRQGEEFLA